LKTKIRTLLLVLVLTLAFSNFSYAMNDKSSAETTDNLSPPTLNSSSTDNYSNSHNSNNTIDTNNSSYNISNSNKKTSSSSGPSELDYIFQQSQNQGYYSQDLSSLPSLYDLRTLGRVTSVKDQGPLGTCWDFASLSSLESSLLPNETWDFSENHIKNLLSDLYPEGFDRSYGGTGFSLWVLAYLARWSGPVNETTDPYNTTSGISPEGLTPVKHVQECVFLLDRTDPLDNDILKEAIMKYGAVTSWMYWDDNYYNENYFAYYLDGQIYPWANHVISLVGWDDNFDKNNFKIPAPGNGAFIIKNSWGTDWKSDNGYFYISYYDAYLGYASNIVFNNAEPNTNYKQIYQYDPFGLVNYITSDGSTSAEFMNVFHAETNNPLTAASFYALSPHHTSYQLYTIVNNITTLVAEGVTETAGYKTIKFNQPIPLLAGQEFKIVAKVNTPTYNTPIAIEYADENTCTSKATSNPGESFIKYNGIWTDLTDPIFSLYPEANVCLKAFTAFAGNLTLNIETSNLQLVVGDLLKFTINAANNGPDNSLGTQVNYILPPGLELTSYQAGMGDYNPVTGIWTIGELEVGKTISLIIYGLVKSPGDYLNVATITSLTYNYNPSNSTSFILHAVNIIVNPQIHIEKSSLSPTTMFTFEGGINATVGSINSLVAGTEENGILSTPLLILAILLICGILIILYFYKM
jgi:uncharacterized repeat protein (TIGR01451 family)